VPKVDGQKTRRGKKKKIRNRRRITERERTEEALFVKGSFGRRGRTGRDIGGRGTKRAGRKKQR